MLQGRPGSRKDRFLGWVGGVLLLLLVFAYSATPAIACDLDPHTQVEGADTLDTAAIGWKATIHTTDFNDSPCDTNRSIFAYDDPGDWLELGWVKLDGYPLFAYYNVREDGTTHPHPNQRFPSPGSDHVYELNNANANYSWGILYDGDNLDNVHEGFNSYPLSLTNSERHHDGDELTAHFDNVKVCHSIGSPCNFNYPYYYAEYGNTTNHNWHFCKDSNHESHVFRSC